MQLSNITILALRGSEKEVKQKIADAVGVAIHTVYRWINDNDDNLTKASALKVIREELGLTDSQILEEEKVNVS
jgi:transcriptional regulator with XRE-family HTH domain